MSHQYRKHLICDTGALIHLIDINKLGYENIYVTPSVIREIKNEQQQHQLTYHAFSLKVSVPSEDDIEIVKCVASQTGDIMALSKTDIEVLALTHMYQRLSPEIYKNKKHITSSSSTDLSTTSDNSLKSNIDSIFSNPTKENHYYIKADQCGLDTLCKNEGHLSNTIAVEKNTKGTNLSNFSKGFGHLKLIERRPENNNPYRISVACFTTDFAIQNVLMHMQIPIFTINEYMIKHTKTWKLFCRGCKTMMDDITRKFCCHCGNYSTLRKVTTTNDNGVYKLFYKNDKSNLRGQIFPIPKPKGGRQGDLILCEDQYLRAAKLKNPKSREEIDFFSGTANVTTLQGLFNAKTISKHKQQPQIAYGRCNPNSNRWRKKHKI